MSVALNRDLRSALFNFMAIWLVRPVPIFLVWREPDSIALLFIEQNHFKAVTALSSLQFQKQLRLQEARRLMLGEDLDATTATYRVGYNDVSHFNRSIKAFLECPQCATFSSCGRILLLFQADASAIH